MGEPSSERRSRPGAGAAEGPHGRRRDAAPFDATAARACATLRPELRRALRRIGRWLGGGAPLVAVRGPQGIGKTLLLAHLADTLMSDMRPVAIPDASLPAGEIAAWALGLLGAPPSGTPLQALVTRAREGPPVVLLLDEAQALPADAARQLARSVKSSAGALHLVAAFGDREDRGALEALGAELLTIEIETPLEADAAAAWITSLLDHADAPATLRRRVAALDLAALCGEAGGNPGRLLALLARATERESAAGPGSPTSRPAPRRGPDPFGSVARADRHVPIGAHESVVARLRERVANGPGVTFVVGPPGVGKTHVARVLAADPPARVVVQAVPYPALPPSGIAAWLLSQLGHARHATPEVELRTVAAGLAAVGRPLLLIVEDAQVLSDDSLRFLASLTEPPCGVHALFTWTEGPGTPATPRIANAAELRLRHTLSPDEIRVYLEARLGAAGVSSEGARLAGDTARLTRESEGVPSALHRLVDARLREASRPARPARPAHPARAPGAPAPADPHAPLHAVRTPTRRPLLRWTAFAALVALAMLLGWVLSANAPF